MTGHRAEARTFRYRYAPTGSGIAPGLRDLVERRRIWELMAGVVVNPIDALSDGQLAQVQVIYEEAFSPNLRVPLSELTRPCDADRTFVAMEGTVPAGLAAFRLLSSVGWSFLRYFAISRQRRSQGLGRQFWQLLHHSLREEDWPVCVIFEVEDPVEVTSDEHERVIRQRRLSFWTACGAHLLPASGYVLPDYTASGMTEPMLLMAAAPAIDTPVRSEQLRSLVAAIYTDRYGLARDDPLVSRALASITA